MEYTAEGSNLKRGAPIKNENVEAKERKKEGLSPNQPQLNFAGDGMKEENTQFAYIQLEVMPRPSVDKMKICVRPLSGRSLMMDVEDTDTVDTLREKIGYKIGFLPDERHLAFGGKQLEDRRYLSEYNIQNGSTIDIVLRLPGGA